jgi:hypothetical protein
MHDEKDLSEQPPEPAAIGTPFPKDHRRLVHGEVTEVGDKRRDCMQENSPWELAPLGVTVGDDGNIPWTYARPKTGAPVSLDILVILLEQITIVACEDANYQADFLMQGARWRTRCVHCGALRDHVYRDEMESDEWVEMVKQYGPPESVGGELAVRAGCLRHAEECEAGQWERRLGDWSDTAQQLLDSRPELSATLLRIRDARSRALWAKMRAANK